MASHDVKFMTDLGLNSNLSTMETDSLFYYARGLENVGPERPVLVLIHGYPQLNFMWRHIIPLLPENIPLFIPDIPGYGRSSPLKQAHNTRSNGKAILKKLESIIPSMIASVPVILVGHDRGARISHRIAVDRQDYPHLEIRGAILLDIIPTLKQWHSFASSSTAAGAFHWPLLANSQLASSMIKSFGGDTWCRTLIKRWSPNAGAALTSDDSFEIYSSFFKKDSVIEATCDDYRAGAEEDVNWQEEDQEAGRKLEVDCLIIYSEDYLGNRGDMKGIWSEWMGKGKLDIAGLDRCGHFVAEEKPQKVADVVVRFWERHYEI